MKVPVVWLLKVPLYGEVDAGYIWNRTATHQLCEVQKWNQSEHDPGYFWKILDDGTFMDLLLYVDDAYVTDCESPLADTEINTFGMAFSPITMASPASRCRSPTTFSEPTSTCTRTRSRGLVKGLHSSDGGQVLAQAARGVPHVPHAVRPKDLVEAYDEARDRVGTLDADGQAAYASKCGAGIFACPCSRFDALYTLGMCSRCLIFPTERMMKATAHLDGYGFIARGQVGTHWRRLD